MHQTSWFKWWLLRLVDNPSPEPMLIYWQLNTETNFGEIWIKKLRICIWKWHIKMSPEEEVDFSVLWNIFAVLRRSCWWRCTDKTCQWAINVGVSDMMDWVVMLTSEYLRPCGVDDKFTTDINHVDDIWDASLWDETTQDMIIDKDKLQYRKLFHFIWL